MNRAVLLVSCPDRRGITANVTDFVFRNGGNILHAAQHTDDAAGVFFMRVEWDMDSFSVPASGVGAAFAPLAQTFGMNWQLHFSRDRVRAAIFVSRHLHCLQDLLFRYQAGQLPGCDLAVVLSNHPDAAPLVHQAGIPFVHIPVSAQNKGEAERQQAALLAEQRIDLAVLARYHQILSADFLHGWEQRIINIHHSFLPAFVGASPYAQAHAKGVKIIGATAHYVTPDLDQGPIIEQDTARIDHRYSVRDIVEAGQDLERVVLYRAVRWHLERRVLCYGNKTVILE